MTAVSWLDWWLGARLLLKYPALATADSLRLSAGWLAGRSLTGQVRKPCAGERRQVSRISASWNQLDGWLRQVERPRRAA